MVLVPSSILITGANRGVGLGILKQWLLYPEVKHIFACVRKPSEESVSDSITLRDYFTLHKFVNVFFFFLFWHSLNSLCT